MKFLCQNKLKKLICGINFYVLLPTWEPFLHLVLVDEVDRRRCEFYKSWFDYLL